MTTQENYNRWLNSNKIDAQVKAQLKAMSKEEIDDVDSHIRLADYLASVVSGILKEHFREKDAKTTISKQVTNYILVMI